jgi:hypothetical protein
MSDLEYWFEDKQLNGWEMPAATWWKRLPVIRHIRAIYYRSKVVRHNAFWISVGKIPTGYDSWVVYGIARGMERRIGDE